MRPKSRATRVAFRRAVWASLALHAVVSCILALVFHAAEEREPKAPGISTVVDDTQVRISQAEETLVVEAPKATTEPEPQPLAVPATPQAADASPLAASPVIPQMLPPELVALIRKPAPTLIGGAVTEVAVPPGSVNPPAADPNVRPAGGPVAGTTSAAVPAIHGALTAGKTVVYVLDSSGSMGAAGKFDKARAALVSTLKLQPPTVRFQVIVYAGTARPLLASDGNGLPATEANVRAATEKLAALEPRGFSDHYGAVRAALAFRPDVLLMLTDAEDLSTAVIKSLVVSVPKQARVCLGQVTAESVRGPRELK